MPPRFLFTKQQLIAAALKLIEREGEAALTARSLAAELNCSSKPIFGQFSGMDELKSEVITAGYDIFYDYIGQVIESGKYPSYKASGIAYTSFAAEKPMLFKLLFMRDRNNEVPLLDDNHTDEIIELIQKSTNIGYETARKIHLEMWIFVHGIATMIATNYLKWDIEFISAALTDCYQGLLKTVAK